MAFSYLKYPLIGGFIHHWLVAGPLATPITEFSAFSQENFRENVLKKFTRAESGVLYPAVDLGPVGQLVDPARAYLAKAEDRWLAWRYYRCQEDHFIDFSAVSPTCNYLCAWAYAQLVCQSTPVNVELVLTTNSPADIWLDGQRLFRSSTFSDQAPRSFILPVRLSAERSELLVRFETVAQGVTPYLAALQVRGLADEQALVCLPTEIEEQYLEQRRELETVVESAYLDRYVFGSLTGDRYNRNEPITVHFNPDLVVSAEISNRCQSQDGWIFQEARVKAQAGASVELAKMFPLRNGPHHLGLLPLASDYYVRKLQFERKQLFYVVRTPFAQISYGTIEERKQEALKDAAERRNDSIYCEVAKIALKEGPRITRDLVAKAIDRVQTRQAGSLVDLLGLLILRRRFWRRKHNLQELKPALETAILSYRYGADQPGADNLDFSAESSQLLVHTCEILAGQLFADRIFSASGQAGRWHKAHGEQLATAWLQSRGRYGFDAWHSPAGFEACLAALAQLVDLAVASVAELAAAVMDKIVFELAVNSFQGAYGAAHAASDLTSVLSPRLSPTAGIARLMWGLGNFNENITGTVSLACCQNYELPEVLRQIALDQPAALWSRESHGVSDRANSVAYKTADFMLSSIQDYQPGAPGANQHLWQATLGPDAVTFVNHPTCLSVSDACQPNLWVGDGALPRLAQWGDVLVAVYQLPQPDWLGFTHAYFPAAAFDEYVLRDNWAFARKGRGYLALTAARGLQWITSGPTALRELRSYGSENIWLCHMGQELLDGTFEEFQQKILIMPVDFKPASASFTSLRGEAIQFGWQGPLTVNGQEQPLSGFRHVENPYCVADLPCEEMTIVYGGEGVRLKFA